MHRETAPKSFGDKPGVRRSISRHLIVRTTLVFRKTGLPEKPDIQRNPIFRDAWYSYKPDTQKPLVFTSSEKPASRRKLRESRERVRERR